MEIRQLESVYWAASLRSFSAAAAHLNTTQPAISGRILQLEQELGVKLFTRAPRRIQLTPKGRDVLRHIEAVLETLSVIRRVSSPDCELTGTVRLGCTNTVAHSWLPQLIAAVHRRYPVLDVDFHVDTSAVLTARHKAGEIDIIICLEQVREPGVTSEFLYQTEFNWVASKKVCFQTDPVSAAELATHRIITYPNGTHLHNAVSTYFKAQGIAHVRLSGSNSVAAILRLAAAGIGICAIPGAAVASQSSEDIRVLTTTVCLPPIDFFISYHAQPTRRAPSAIAEIAHLLCADNASMHQKR